MHDAFHVYLMVSILNIGTLELAILLVLDARGWLPRLEN